LKKEKEITLRQTADKIYMLDNGRIIEEGTHDELLELNGKYKEMRKAQASKYV